MGYPKNLKTNMYVLVVLNKLYFKNKFIKL